MTTQDAAATGSDTFADVFNTICDNIERTIRGKRDVVHLVVLSLVAEGHVLLEDAPGVGKTSLGKALAASVNATFGRVQFTPDLLPADVIGTNIGMLAKMSIATPALTRKAGMILPSGWRTDRKLISIVPVNAPKL